MVLWQPKCLIYTIFMAEKATQCKQIIRKSVEISDSYFKLRACNIFILFFLDYCKGVAFGPAADCSCNMALRGHSRISRQYECYLWRHLAGHDIYFSL